jgi:hypothetical protein
MELSFFAPEVAIATAAFYSLRHLWATLGQRSWQRLGWYAYVALCIYAIVILGF